MITIKRFHQCLFFCFFYFSPPSILLLVFLPFLFFILFCFVSLFSTLTIIKFIFTMIVRRLSNIGCILSYFIAFSLFISSAQLQPPPTQPPQQQPPQVDCPHPTNYSDFNILLMNNTIVVTGGSLVMSTLSTKIVVL